MDHQQQLEIVTQDVDIIMTSWIDGWMDIMQKVESYFHSQTHRCIKSVFLT